jgi:glycosyltransferase involved in cell wall biosynthesis
MRDAVAQLGLEQWVDAREWVPRDELYELFRTARAFVYPTRFEGFGMPVIEALAARVPVACSAIEPLRTLAGPHPVYFDPDSDQSMLDALRQVLKREPPPIGAAAAFSWRRCAELTLQSLDRAVRERRR